MVITKKKRGFIRRLGLYVVTILVVGWGAVSGFRADAAELPERPPDPPAAGVTVTNSGSGMGEQSRGGTIELIGVSNRADGAVAAELWTEIEWEDAQGDWHRVDGWRGGYDDRGRVVWWVGREQLGEQNFRWMVYAVQAPDEGAGAKTLLAISPTFDLPSQSGEQVSVTINWD